MNSAKSKKKYHAKRNPNHQNVKTNKKNQCEKNLPSAAVLLKDDKNDGVDSGHGSDAASTTPMVNHSPVDKMTSREFQFDKNAHIEMLDQFIKDKVRMQTFKAAIIHNQHLFKGKTVLDIGCGIGILSLFAAKAGAAKVYAIDTSNVIYYTRDIVAANGYGNVIEVYKGAVEDIELPVKQVDIIVSDWVGYALLYQSKCRAVIYARDKYLKPGGLIFPDQGKLFIVAIEDESHKTDNIEWWNCVYGFNMKCVRAAALREPRIQQLKPKQVLSNQYPIKSLDLYTDKITDLGFRSKYLLPIQKTGRMDGIALYFHIYFTKSHTPLGFSTDPWSPRTNWMQTVFFFDQSLMVRNRVLYYGGIEFVPTKTNGALDDIIVNMEMLKGDPVQVDYEMYMTWHMKSAITNSEEEPTQAIMKTNEAKCLDEYAEQINEKMESDVKSLEKLSLNNTSDIVNNPKIQQHNNVNNDDDWHLIKPLDSMVHSSTCLNWCKLTNNNNTSNINCDEQSIMPLAATNANATFHGERSSKKKRSKRDGNMQIMSSPTCIENTLKAHPENKETTAASDDAQCSVIGSHWSNYAAMEFTPMERI